MTEHVTDTNVGKMTGQDAIHEIELMEQMECACPDCERRRPALVMAIEALQFQQSVVRCKDCASLVTNDSTNTIMYVCGRHHYDRTKPEGYCHKGKRRDEE